MDWIVVYAAYASSPVCPSWASAVELVYIVYAVYAFVPRVSLERMCQSMAMLVVGGGVLVYSLRPSLFQGSSCYLVKV